MQQLLVQSWGEENTLGASGMGIQGRALGKEPVQLVA